MACLDLDTTLDGVPLSDLIQPEDRCGTSYDDLLLLPGGKTAALLSAVEALQSDVPVEIIPAGTPPKADDPQTPEPPRAPAPPPQNKPEPPRR